MADILDCCCASFSLYSSILKSLINTFLLHKVILGIIYNNANNRVEGAGLMKEEMNQTVGIQAIINEIKSNIDKLLKSKETILIAIDGKSGSGKSTLAEELNKKYDLNIFHMDDFFLPKDLRSEERLNETGGNVDYVRFKEEVINSLLLDSDFNYRIFDCRVMDLTDTIRIKQKRINIIEGSYSFHPSLIDSYDLKIFLDIGDNIQKKRIEKRNGSVMLEKFIAEWIPKENKYFDQMQIRGKSDLYFKMD